jgi:pyruvate,water dikinase
VVRADLATGAERGRSGPGPLLAAAEVEALVALGRRVAADAGTPQDLEWALDRSGALHLLQARPITAFAAGRETIFDSANIVESYPGVTRPLTFSFVRPAYERTLREASRRFGVDEATLAAERAVHANLVALVDGRIHYAILNWYRLYRQLPGFAWALPAFEKALGLPRRWVAPDPPLAGLARLARAATVGRAWLRLAGLLRGLDAGAARFGARLEAERARLPAGLDGQDPHALLDQLDRLSDQLTGPYAVALVNDFFTFQLHALVERLLVRFGAADAARAPTLRDALLVGIQGLESLEPLRSVAGLARRAAALPPVLALLASPRGDAEVWDALAETPGAAGFLGACQAHLTRHGDRTLEELKLETPSLTEAPGGLVGAIRMALAADVDPERLAAGRSEAREAAETAVARALAGHPLRAALFHWAVGHWRRGVRRREALRLARARGFGLAKRLYRALGRHLVRAGLLDEPGDLLWLTVDEVDGAVRGHAVTRDLRALVALRRREWAGYERRSPAPRTTTHGIATARRPEEAMVEAEGGAEVLRGAGCSPGVGRGPARVVLDPRDATMRPGEVLVAATTDPGWIFLMAGAAALVAERGNPLSHTAIVGRELGLPTVVGVAGATRLLVTGEPLVVDGAAGTVRRGAAAAAQSARPRRA